MTDAKISDLIAADPISDTDLFEVSQGGNSRKGTGAQLKTYAGGGGGSGRTLLTTDLTINVPADQPTIQAALNHAAETVDLGGIFNVFIQLAAGGYSENVVVPRMVGQGLPENLQLVGDTGTPSNVILQSSGGASIQAGQGAGLLVTGVQFIGDTGLQALNGGQIKFDACDFATLDNQHMDAAGGTISSFGSHAYTISGGATNHFRAGTSPGVINVEGTSVTINNTPNFSNFADIENDAVLQMFGASFSGAATGPRFYVFAAGIYGSNDLDALPGDSAGFVDIGGVYGSLINVTLIPQTAPGNPFAGWQIYTDSGDSNKLKAIASTGTIVTLGTP